MHYWLRLQLSAARVKAWSHWIKGWTISSPLCRLPPFLAVFYLPPQGILSPQHTFLPGCQHGAPITTTRTISPHRSSPHPVRLASRHALPTGWGRIGGEGAPSFKAGRANTRNGGAAAWFSADKTIPVCSSEKRRPLTPCLRQSPSALFIIPIHHKFLPVPVSCFQSLSVMGPSSARFQNKMKSMQRRRSDPSRWSAHLLYVLEKNSAGKKIWPKKTPQNWSWK